jgi:hypothetical protein
LALKSSELHAKVGISVSMLEVKEGSHIIREQSMTVCLVEHLIIEVTHVLSLL